MCLCVCASVLVWEKGGFCHLCWSGRRGDSAICVGLGEGGILPSVLVWEKGGFCHLCWSGRRGDSAICVGLGEGRILPSVLVWEKGGFCHLCWSGGGGGGGVLPSVLVWEKGGFCHLCWSGRGVGGGGSAVCVGLGEGGILPSVLVWENGGSGQPVTAPRHNGGSYSLQKTGKTKTPSAAWVACQFWPQGKLRHLLQPGWPVSFGRRESGNVMMTVHRQPAEGASQTQRLRGRPNKGPGKQDAKFR